MLDFTLDEAIKQHEAIAAEQRELYGLCPCPCNGLTNCMCLESGKDKGCMKLQYEHQQLADWLKELKELKSKADESQPKIQAYWNELPKAMNPAETPCQCSNCEHVLSFMNHYPKSKYCPNCGARMDLKEEDTND